MDKKLNPVYLPASLVQVYKSKNGLLVHTACDLGLAEVVQADTSRFARCCNVVACACGAEDAEPPFTLATQDEAKGHWEDMAYLATTRG